MLTLITSCGRPDLLSITMCSLKAEYNKLKIKIYEDSNDPDKANRCGWVASDLSNEIIFTNGIGQHRAIEKFLSENNNEKYFLGCEDDWLFNNSYDWIKASIDIMESDPSIIKVLCRSDAVHPVKYNRSIATAKAIGMPPRASISPGPMYGYLEPWTDPWHNTLWHGFSWNPGVTRLDLLKKFIPFGQWEQDVSKAVYDAGYKVVMLEKGVCKHIGDGRSTHS